MPAVIRSEFALALNQVCSERGISPETVLETITAAIIAAYRKDYGGEMEDYLAQINSDSGEAKIYKKTSEGEKGKEITPPGFGRIAAQTAKQVILQKIREAEKSAILTDYSGRVGNLVNGTILRYDGSNIIVDISKTEAIMPSPEQIPAEHYRPNQRLTFYILEIREGTRGGEIIVSRSHKKLVEALFRREVPEIASKAVEIKEIAREPGSRTKIAVFSPQAGVDPVGSCVGQKGVRVNAVINELGNEKIDIIQWNEDPEKFICASLSPAKEIEVLRLDKKGLVAKVAVPVEQLSLAIGREGQNVRLAARLTGFKIDLEEKAEKEVLETKEEKESKPEVVSTSASPSAKPPAPSKKKPAKKKKETKKPA
ncbi:MAG: transcription termination factor NusA [bacterium]|nr:transcription termination factor NusA [bacterium]